MSDTKYPLAYACYNKNSAIRENSTSGGVFTVLAEYILRKGGVVFGAAFDKDFVVRHIMVDTTDGLTRLRGSKYPQSHIGDCFAQAKALLEKGTLVLFTGSPCQISGLKRYLGKEYENLLCMDFICHGVASPKVWAEYLQEWRNKKNIVNIEFKNKITGWKKWHVKIEYKDHVWYRRGSMEPFMRSYLRYANIRPSCYACRFKGLVHDSDFTISDCWGIGENNKRLNDNRGLSSLLLQNKRAKYFFEQLCSQLIYESYDADELMKGNWTAYRSVSPSPKRTDFFRALKERGAKYALKKYFAPSVKDWLAYYWLVFKGKEK